jgi:hypothetical protein
MRRVVPAVFVLLSLAGCSAGSHSGAPRGAETTAMMTTALEPPKVVALPPVTAAMLPSGPSGRCEITISWPAPRYANGYARFVLRVVSDDPGSIFEQIRDLNTDESATWNGETDGSGSDRLTDAVGPKIHGRAQVLVRINGKRRIDCSTLTIAPN